MRFARIQRFVLCTLVGVLWVALPAAAQTVDRGSDRAGDTAWPMPDLPLDAETLPDALLEEARLLLSGIHGAPERALLEARLPQARELVMLLALDPELLPWQRPQALWALAQWGADRDVLATYRAVLEEGEEVLVHHALALLAQVGGAETVGLLAPYLEHEDLQVRLSAIAALGGVADSSALEALEAARAREVHPVALERLTRALQQVR